MTYAANVKFMGQPQNPSPFTVFEIYTLLV
jgi:hypothetical protein